jgi:prepilin-type N-terminal cleavage/methylation domain-containing protein
MLHPPSLTPRSRRGFTIIEIVVVLIIIALMLIIIVPHFLNGLKARKAQWVKDDLVALNSAIEHYALDNGKVGGVQLNYADLRKYLDPKTEVCRRDGRDIFGDSYGPFSVGTRPSIPPRTAEKLSEVVSDDFWSPFQ